MPTEDSIMVPFPVTDKPIDSKSNSSHEDNQEYFKMKKSREQILTIVTAIACVLTCACGAPEEGLVEDLGTLMPGEPESPEVAKAMPGIVKVFFADDLLHVSRITLRPGVSIPEIESGHRLYYLPIGTAELAIEQDGEMSLTNLSRGEIRYTAPGPVKITNTGALPVELIEVARTDVMLPEFLETPNQEAGFGHEILFENDMVIVRELNLEVDATADLSAVPVRAFYLDQETILEFASADGDVVPIPTTTPAAAYSRDGDDLSVTNRGDEPVRVVLFEWLI